MSDAELELESKVRAALDAVRPALQADGGDLEFLGLASSDAGVVAQVRLHGACRSCPSQALTLKHAVEAQLKRAVPEIASLALVDAEQKRGWNIY